MFTKSAIATIALYTSTNAVSMSVDSPVPEATYADWLKLKDLMYNFHVNVEHSMHCFIEGSQASGDEWCVFMREEGLPAVRETLSTLAGSEECMHEFVCGESFRLVPAEDKEDEYANYIETRRLSNAFNYAVEQSMLCYLDTAVG